MKLPRPVYIRAFSTACALGGSSQEVADNLFSERPPALAGSARLISGRTVPTGRLRFDPLAISEGSIGQTRSNRLLAHVLTPLLGELEAATAVVGPRRVGVVIGTSTTGIGEASDAIRLWKGGAPAPDAAVLARQELFDPVRAALTMVAAQGPAYGISTACTSSAKAIAAAARMITVGMCDVVLCGGVDTLSELTLNGFDALDTLSETVSCPFSVNRRGINLGEGSALFVLTAAPARYRLAGWGESSDAYHISSPDPSGAGAELALRKALAMAAIAPEAVDYVHLHGTGTALNDAMEARAVNTVFGAETPCSSTKPMTGHTLGAAGALQMAFCLMAMKQSRLPPHLWDGQSDPDLAPIHLVGSPQSARIDRTISANYAFGGNNIALAIAA